MTNKQLILYFVALQGKKGARYTDIIKFIYEHNNPLLTYQPVSNRGYYSCAFSSFGYDGKDKRYLLKGKNRLEKIGNRYYVADPTDDWCHYSSMPSPKSYTNKPVWED